MFLRTARQDWNGACAPCAIDSLRNDMAARQGAEPVRGLVQHRGGECREQGGAADGDGPEKAERAQHERVSHRDMAVEHRA